jgi:hypothetical protein
MGLLHDGAGIYTLSRQPGTRIVENYIHDIVRSRWTGESAVVGIYLDNGSSGLTVERNVLERVPDAPPHSRHPKIYEQVHSWPEAPVASGNVIRDNDDQLGEVIRTAGIQPPYRDAADGLR